MPELHTKGLDRSRTLRALQTARLKYQAVQIQDHRRICPCFVHQAYSDYLKSAWARIIFVNPTLFRFHFQKPSTTILLWECQRALLSCAHSS
jgi:hypothetical protein